MAYEKLEFTIPNECPDRNSESKLLLAMMLAKSNDQFEAWDKFLEKCPSSLGKESYEIIKFKPSYNYKTENEKFLKELDEEVSDQDLRESFKLVLSKKYGQPFNNEALLNLNLALGMVKQNLAIADKFFIYQKMLNDKTTENSTFLGGLVRILMAIDNGNKAWVKKEIDNIANISFYEIIIDLSPVEFLNVEKKTVFKQSIIEALTYISEKYPKEFFLKALLVHLNEYFKLEEIESLKSNASAKWSLSDARDLIKSKTTGTTYPGLWFMFLTARTSVLEVNNFLDTAFTSARVNQFDFSDFWPFLYYTPKDEVIRSQIWSKISEVKEHEINVHSRYERFLQIELLGHGYNRTKATQLENELKRTPFQLRREYFRENIQNGVAPLWSIYELLKLGDVDRDMALWFIKI